MSFKPPSRLLRVATFGGLWAIVGSVLDIGSLHTDAFLHQIWLRLQGHASSSPDVLLDVIMKMGAIIVDGTFTP